MGMLGMVEIEGFTALRTRGALVPKQLGIGQVILKEAANGDNWENSECEAPRPQAGASRKRIIFLIVPLDPAYPALAGRGTCRPIRRVIVQARSESLRRQAIQGKTSGSPRRVLHNACSGLRPPPRDGLPF